MVYLQDILQITVGLGILNVWLLRFQNKTSYRGGESSNMKQEFAHYGLPNWSVYVIGFFKISSAAGLLVGIFITPFVLPSAILLATLMLGAVSMHAKVSDPIKKSIPALCILAMAILIVLLSV
ncbi:MAG: DoxX family protein [Puniceicoccaceae bacterium]|jgi:hypothetical protein|nr:DoxX family protein [Puniceicoccaceae bacterium]MBL6829264.1 DoxX family protein [Puniceicoccaceae bacterium]MBL6912561.1 DoxX family protein [Puniceicoccaceae bacterium]